MNSGHFRWFVIIVIFPVLPLMFFNWIINPYEIFSSPNFKHLNEIKIISGEHVRLYRAIQVATQKPEVIFFGTSRVMAGCDPNDLKELKDHFIGKIYNCGFLGASLKEIYHYFNHALYYQPNLKLIILGLDFFSFGRFNGDPGFSLDLLQDKIFSFEHKLSLLCNRKSVLTSLTTLKANLITKSEPSFLSNGMYNQALLPKKKANVEEDQALLKYMSTADDFYGRYELDYSHIDYFRRLVSDCKEKNIALKVFFCPTKAIYWELLHRKNLWPVLEELKRELCQIYPIWDFTGFNIVTTESIESEEICLFNECSHFKPNVGKMILNKLFNESNVDAKFGYYLIPDTIEDVLLEIHKERLKWLESKPKMMEEFSSVLSSIGFK